jgi:hypothetical protein
MKNTVGLLATKEASTEVSNLPPKYRTSVQNAEQRLKGHFPTCYSNPHSEHVFSLLNTMVLAWEILRPWSARIYRFAPRRDWGGREACGLPSISLIRRWLQPAKKLTTRNRFCARRSGVEGKLPKQ